MVYLLIYFPLYVVLLIHVYGQTHTTVFLKNTPQTEYKSDIPGSMCFQSQCYVDGYIMICSNQSIHTL